MSFVSQPGMHPVFEDGDWLLALQHWPSRWLQRGQIIVTWLAPSAWYPASLSGLTHRCHLIKRIVGLPGDVIVTHISEVPVDLQFSLQSVHNNAGNRAWHIPPGHCFIQGDSRGFDSVIMGPVPFHSICGVVLVKLPRKSAPNQIQTLLPDPLRVPGDETHN